jgi:ribosomal protein S18 acetylase RimI-like enzyme
VTIDFIRRRPAIADQISALTERDIDRLRLGSWSRLTHADIRRAVQRYPGRSVWIADTLEYAVVSPWRHRPEIANVTEVAAVRHADELLAAVLDRARAHEAAAVISLELNEIRRPAFYERAGFALIEQVVTYNLEPVRPVRAGERRLRFRPANLLDDGDVSLLLDLDRLTFPWIWRNNREEIRSYAFAPGVEVFLGYLDQEPVAYVGVTAYFGWGHLDRIAVTPGMQGEGFGREALAFAIARLASAGARRIGLSTQEANVRSQRLYEGFGFRRVAANDYRLYGNVLKLPDGVKSLQDIDNG